MLDEIIDQTRDYIGGFIAYTGLSKPLIYTVLAVLLVFLLRELLIWRSRRKQIELLEEIRLSLTVEAEQGTRLQKPGKSLGIKEQKSMFKKIVGSKKIERGEGRFEWLLTQPFNEMSEYDFKEVIHETHSNGQFEECKKYIEYFINAYPESPYIDFVAKPRLKEINAKLGQQVLEGRAPQ